MTIVDIAVWREEDLLHAAININFFGLIKPFAVSFIISYTILLFAYDIIRVFHRIKSVLMTAEKSLKLHYLVYL